MRHKNIFEVTDIDTEDLRKLIKRTIYFSKNNKKQFSCLKGIRVCLLFDSASLRTKMSFEIAIHKMGGFPYYIPINSITHEYDNSPRECYEDIIETLDRFVDLYVVRDYSRKMIEVLARKNNPPIINGLSIIGHPSQALADVSIITKKKMTIDGLSICIVAPSSGSGVIESFIYSILKLGNNVTLVTPTGKFIGKNIDFNESVRNMPGKLFITKDTSVIQCADVLYVDEWWEDRHDFLEQKPPEGYKVDKNFLVNTKKDLIILHCLPAHHEREISEEVIWSDQSVVFEEAEFRIYSAMALLEYMVKE